MSVEILSRLAARLAAGLGLDACHFFDKLNALARFGFEFWDMIGRANGRRKCISWKLKSNGCYSGVSPMGLGSFLATLLAKFAK